MDKVVYFEIPYDNKDRAVRFYSETFGWQLEDRQVGDHKNHGHKSHNENNSESGGVHEMIYTDVIAAEIGEGLGTSKERGAINGGMVRRGFQGDAPQGPVITIEVDSIDDHVKKIKVNGGDVMISKMSIGKKGFYAYIKDSEGNILVYGRN